MTYSAAHVEPPQGHSPPPEFWEKVRRAPHRLLMLDYDGTLVPYRIEWTKAALPERTRTLLERVSNRTSTSLVILSGRRVFELESLLGPIRVHLVGEHGWEERTAEGQLTVRPVSGAIAKRLGREARAARACGWGPLLERKRCSLVLHTRALTRAKAASIEERCSGIWAEACAQEGFRLMRVDGGLELRAFARHEGDMVADLIASTPPHALPVYLGDDRCDEDAFFQVLGRGIAIRVGTSVRDSIADFRLTSAEDVLAFLEQWDTILRVS